MYVLHMLLALVYSDVICFTALHGMQTRSSDGNSVRPTKA